MLDGLKKALDGTGYEFVFGAWIGDIRKDHGVYMLDDQAQLRTDSESASEKILRGFVDYYTHDTSFTPMEKIEEALSSLGVWWRFESVQFEAETGHLHYEYRFADVTGTAAAETA